MREWMQYGLVAAITATVIEIARRIFKIEIFNRGRMGRLDRVLESFDLGIEQKGERLYTLTAKFRDGNQYRIQEEYRVDHNSAEAGLELLIKVIDKAEMAEWQASDEC